MPQEEMKFLGGELEFPVGEESALTSSYLDALGVGKPG